jgi:predicted MFS family arabinose efflux permease
MGEASARVPWAAWYGLAVLTAVNSLAQIDRIALAVLLQPIKTELHLSDQQLGLLSGVAFALFYATLGLPLARYADRASRTRLLSACLALWTVMTTLSGFARSFPQLFLARVGVGVGEAGSLPASYSLIADMFPRTRRTLTIAIFQCGGTIGISVGTFIVGMFGHYLGWRACLQLIGLAGLPFALLVLFTVPEAQRPDPGKNAGEPVRQVFGSLLRRPAFVHIMAAYTLAGITSLGIGQWNPAYLMRSFGLNMAQVGAWAGLATAVGSILGLLAGGSVATWAARRDTRWELWIPAIATLFAFPCAVFLALSPVVWMALMFKIVMAVGSSVASGVAIAALQAFVEPHRRATAVSLVLFFHSVLGLGFGPYMIGLASDLLTPAFGTESLRYGILIASLFLPWAAFHYLLAARRSLQDSVN